MTNEKEAMEGLLARAVKICTEPIDDRENRPDHLPSLRAIAEELEVTTIKARKLLITADYFSSIMSREVKRLSDGGLSPKQIGERLGLGPAAVYGYLPYKTVAYSLDEISANASRHKRYRDRAEAVKELLNRMDELSLWKCVIAFEGYEFRTSGRGSRPGIRFKYKVSTPGGRGGHHFSGENVDGYGNEILIEGKEKSISRSTVNYAFRKVVEMDGKVGGPKKLNVPGAHSYLYAMFLRFGVIKKDQIE